MSVREWCMSVCMFVYAQSSEGVKSTRRSAGGSLLCSWEQGSSRAPYKSMCAAILVVNRTWLRLQARCGVSGTGMFLPDRRQAMFLQGRRALAKIRPHRL